ncbi:hypothetical protein [Legionella clemsonensis]|uniref:Uncharacterized protein n=1 Tax=Legionella clemsonensis TaxID=1867846 RepID=A0A222P3Y4_9GAMM|nr:hypothetical protein [Legionella clemsonensis]ASQ46485.1 hypothetical protein clem_09675 [Legionella clemsonensis]
MHKEQFNSSFDFITAQWNLQVLPVFEMFIHNIIHFYDPDNLQDANSIKMEWEHFKSVVELLLTWINDLIPDEQLDATQKQYKTSYRQRIYDTYQEALKRGEHALLAKRTLIYQWRIAQLYASQQTPSSNPTPMMPAVTTLPLSQKQESPAVLQPQVTYSDIAMKPNIIFLSPPPSTTVTQQEIASSEPKSKPLSQASKNNSSLVSPFW